MHFYTKFYNALYWKILVCGIVLSFCESGHIYFLLLQIVLSNLLVLLKMYVSAHPSTLIKTFRTQIRSGITIQVSDADPVLTL